uniref:AT-rich interaction domain 4A n=1 Tax=Stegastes partitus TaxID=144197 RepID=A0A3B4ZEB8_9TELE
FQAADEPAYLTVGTDVSAKYRGAFCEAKIKTVKRMVKVKVTLKGESTSQVVQDDQVKGPLRVGSTVEVKTNEGLCSEAVISKLTDASLYTVVFDDGDEKTLRRTSLCLKGERHFAESETLDQLPLTNPEHFGTPVIGKKSNRGGRRSSQAVADEENESSSSEDEEDDRRRLNDELLGTVCSEVMKLHSGVFVLQVVSPSCNDELVVKKDQCLVRSHYDSHNAPGRRLTDRRFLLLHHHNFCFPPAGLEAAQMFLRSREVSEVWKMDMSQILDSSSSEDEDDEEEKESEDEEEDDDEEKKKKKHIKEEELDPEERDHFLQQLYKFMEDRGTPINKPPVLGYKDLNLFKLFRLVYHLGGCHKIESGTVWKQVYMDLGIPVLNSAASYNVKTAYKKYLYGFEEYCRSASITFRTIHHNNPRPPAPPANQKPAGAEPKETPTPQVKAEPVDENREETESESESEKEEVKEMQSSPRGRRRCVGSRVKVEREAPSRPEKRGENSEEQQREVRRRSNRRMDDSEKGSDEDEDEEDDEDDEDDGERRRGDRTDEDEDGDSVTGTKVRVKYGRGKTQKIYEAHIKKTDVDNGEQFYLVHYYGWNVRYDEWVKADRIIWPAEKGTKKRQRRKMKNKDEPEKDEDKPAAMVAAPKPTGAKRGRPPIRTTPTSAAGRSVSKTPSSERRSNGKSSRTETTTAPINSLISNLPDSGNSSDDSESEDPPDKKPSPWRGRAEAPPLPAEASPSRTPPPLPQPDALSKTPERPPPTAEEDDRSPPLSSPRVKGRRANLRESGAETPPRIPLCSPAASPSQTTALSSPPRNVLKRQDEPMVVLHCLPSQRLRPDSPAADSDTDSATEEEDGEDNGEGSPEDRSVAIKRKAAEQRAPEKKPRPDRKQEDAASPKTPAATPKMAAGASPKTLPSPLRSERRSEVMTKAEDWPRPAEEASEERLVGGAMKEPEVHAGTPPPAPEAPGPAPAEELEPPMGPEALVCHEVDLDDPDEKEKPVSSEHLLLMMREQQAPPPLPHLLHAALPSPHLPQPQVRPFFPAAAPSSAPCPEELHLAKSEEEQGAMRAEPEGDSSPGFDASSSSTSLSSFHLHLIRHLLMSDGEDVSFRLSVDVPTFSFNPSQHKLFDFNDEEN